MRSAADRIEARLTALLSPPTIALVPLRADGHRIGFLTPDRRTGSTVRCNAAPR
jgi:hypothetical protein